MSDIEEILDKIGSEDWYKNNKSKYTNSNGYYIPRVTEIISKMISNDILLYWANSLGFKRLKYKDVLNKAANIGTEAHSAIEKFFKDKFKTDNNIPFLGFLEWYNDIETSGLQIEPIFIEKELICNLFGGTLDALLRIGGRVFIVDFKTSNHVTYSYFLQLAAYNYILKLLGINVDGVLVLQLDKESPGYNEYILDFSYIEHVTFFNNCETAFLSLLYGFYNIYNIERQFGTIFNKS